MSNLVASQPEVFESRRFPGEDPTTEVLPEVEAANRFNMAIYSLGAVATNVAFNTGTHIAQTLDVVRTSVKEVVEKSKRSNTIRATAAGLSFAAVAIPGAALAQDTAPAQGVQAAFAQECADRVKGGIGSVKITVKGNRATVKAAVAQGKGDCDTDGTVPGDTNNLLDMGDYGYSAYALKYNQTTRRWAKVGKEKKLVEDQVSESGAINTTIVLPRMPRNATTAKYKGVIKKTFDPHNPATQAPKPGLFISKAATITRTRNR